MVWEHKTAVRRIQLCLASTVVHTTYFNYIAIHIKPGMMQYGHKHANQEWQKYTFGSHPPIHVSSVFKRLKIIVYIA